MKSYSRILILTLAAQLAIFSTASAWEMHTLIAHPVFSSMETIVSRDSVMVTSLETFLLDVEEELAVTLEQEEAWAVENLEWYPPRPEAFIFKATGDPSDIRKRFIEAVRINPESKLISYLQLLPGDDPGIHPILAPEDVNTFKQNRGFYNVTFVGLEDSSIIDPLSVLVTANHEPDLGLDIGLYENNGTEIGKIYGLGRQPFGNPNLEYGSQAPIHMGLYHEAKLINAAAPFLQECLPEYRIHMYKTLATLAFRTGHDYWGWRFMGWGLHYIADMAQPYHASALPGVSTAKMITMNILDMIGFGKMKTRAVQLVSNRHMAIEIFERQVLEEAYLATNMDYFQFQTLRSVKNTPPYHDDVPRDILGRDSYAEAKKLDQLISKNFPKKLVSDPKFEMGESKEKYQVLEILKKSENPDAIKNLEQSINELLIPFAMYGPAYATSILEASSNTE